MEQDERDLLDEVLEEGQLSEYEKVLLPSESPYAPGDDVSAVLEDYQESFKRVL